MKKLYKIIFALGVTILSTSCSDWLNVCPSDQIKEEFLFQTGDGYRSALNGIYRKMTSWSLYGSNLSWGIIDAWGQVYDMELCGYQDGGRAMQRIEEAKFKDPELTPTTDQMWADAWNVVANCNELAQKAEQADSAMFYSGELERKMILGEAIAVRAYMQFDLLRIYAPSLAMNPGSRTFIPYIDTYPAYVSERRSVQYCLDKIIKDLQTAQQLLEVVDKNVGWDYHFEQRSNNEKLFLSCRGFRMNYYAVTATLARVYLYAGQLEEAYKQAEIIIKKKDFFQAITSSYEGKRSIVELGNLKMYDDVIFALYSPTDLVEWDRLINHSNDKSADSYEQELFLGFTWSVADERYGADMDKDWRIVYQMQERNSGDFSSMKYFEQPKNYKLAKTNNAMIPMFRMSEVYYIAAEAIYKKDLEQAKKYLINVKIGRGLKPNLEEVTEKDFMDVLVNDAQREFFGEGQTFYMFKRLMRTMQGGKELVPSETTAVLPLPDSENNI